MDCRKCHMIGHSGNEPVCGVLLQGGETVFIKNGKINEECPLTYMNLDEPKDSENIRRWLQRQFPSGIGLGDVVKTYCYYKFATNDTEENLKRQEELLAIMNDMASYARTPAFVYGEIKDA